MMTKTYLLAALISGACVASGCSSSSSHHARSDYPDNRVGSRVGTTASGYAVAQGTGKIGFRAEQDGLVTVVNTKRSQEIVSQRIRRGDVVEVTPSNDTVTVNGQRIFDRNLERNEPHAILFRPEGVARDGRYDYDYDRSRPAGDRYDPTYNPNTPPYPYRR